MLSLNKSEYATVEIDQRYT